MSKAPIFLLALFCTVFAFGQNNKTSASLGSLQGNIQDATTGKPVKGATVYLFNMADTGQKKIILSDNNGSFSFDKITFGYYKLSITALSFANFTVDSIWVRAEKDELVFNDIQLKDAATTLNEVVVYSDKKLIEDKDGVLTYNVSESPIANGANATDILKNMPLVNANPDGSLTVKGKMPLILIDEKPTNLNAQQLADLLESLPANVIEKVELMQTPPPEYATYDGSVINIVSKKGRIGFSQRYAISAGTRGEGSASSSINYKSPKLSLSSNINLGAGENYGNSWTRRQNIFKDSSNYFYSETNFYNKNWHPNVRLQADYDFNKRNSIGFVYQGNTNYVNNNSNTQYTNINNNLAIWKTSERNVHFIGNNYSHGFTGSYLWKGKNPAEKIQIYSGINFGKNQNDKDFLQQGFATNKLLQEYIPIGSDSAQNQLSDNFNTSYYLRFNYAKPLNSSAKKILNTGFSFTGNDNHNILNANYFNNANNAYYLIDSLSNNFFFYQTIITARVGSVFILPAGWRIIFGAQTEYTTASFDFVKGNAVNANNNYWRLLPNLTFRKEFTKQLNAALTFKQTIRRPGIAELNPSIDYTDPFNVRFGNPYIKPALTNSIDFTFGFSGKKINVNSSFGYNTIKDVFSPIRTLVATGITQTTYKNISDQVEYQASIWTGITVTRKFKLNISTGLNYNKYNEADKLLLRYRDGGSYYVGLNYTYTPGPLTMLEASNKYNNIANPQGKSRSNINMRLSIQHKFLNKKLVANLAVVDPFGLTKFVGFTQGSNFIVNSNSFSNTRNYKLTISYQLSKNFVEKKKKQKIKKH
jgi:hypothetical protein